MNRFLVRFFLIALSFVSALHSMHEDAHYILRHAHEHLGSNNIYTRNIEKPLAMLDKLVNLNLLRCDENHEFAPITENDDVSSKRYLKILQALGFTEFNSSEASSKFTRHLQEISLLMNTFTSGDFYLDQIRFLRSPLRDLVAIYENASKQTGGVFSRELNLCDASPFSEISIKSLQSFRERLMQLEKDDTDYRRNYILKYAHQTLTPDFIKSNHLLKVYLGFLNELTNDNLISRDKVTGYGDISRRNYNAFTTRYVLAEIPCYKDDFIDETRFSEHLDHITTMIELLIETPQLKFLEPSLKNEITLYLTMLRFNKRLFPQGLDSSVLKDAHKNAFRKFGFEIPTIKEEYVPEHEILQHLFINLGRNFLKKEKLEKVAETLDRLSKLGLISDGSVHELLQKNRDVLSSLQILKNNVINKRDFIEHVKGLIRLQTIVFPHETTPNFNVDFLKQRLDDLIRIHLVSLMRDREIFDDKLQAEVLNELGDLNLGDKFFKTCPDQILLRATPSLLKRSGEAFHMLNSLLNADLIPYSYSHNIFEFQRKIIGLDEADQPKLEHELSVEEILEKSTYSTDAYLKILTHLNIYKDGILDETAFFHHMELFSQLVELRFEISNTTDFFGAALENLAFMHTRALKLEKNLFSDATRKNAVDIMFRLKVDYLLTRPG